MKKGSRQKESTWIKNHPMEGDDIITTFYDFLCKRNPKTMKPCPSVYVPDTVVYEHNFPRGWYTTDVKAKEFMRRQGKDLDAATIEFGFRGEVAPNCPIVATYLSTVEEDVGHGVTETKTQVEVLSKDDIGAFIARKNKNNGILQRFVFPKGYHNSMIKVVWSPRIAMIQRRTNKYAIKDRKRAENDPFAITVTYEGPEYLSEETSVSAHVAFEVKNICSEIIKHFFYTEHKYITRMVLYFKNDVKDRLWLLWCGSLRVSERNSPTNMPMNLAPKFDEPSREGDLNEVEVLERADKAYFVVTNDGRFYDTYLRGTNFRAESKAELRQSRSAGSTGSTTIQVKFPNEDVRDMYEEEYVPDDLKVLLEGLQALEDTVLDSFRDSYYLAASHFLQSESRPFEFLISAGIVKIFTPESVIDLMKMLKLEESPFSVAAREKNASAAAATANSSPKATSEDQRDVLSTETGHGANIPVEPMIYIIPSKFSMPLTMMRDRTEDFVKEVFSRRRAQLRHNFYAGDGGTKMSPSCRSLSWRVDADDVRYSTSANSRRVSYVTLDSR